MSPKWRLEVPISVTHQCYPSVLPISVTHQCCHDSREVPISVLPWQPRAMFWQAHQVPRQLVWWPIIRHIAQGHFQEYLSGTSDLSEGRSPDAIGWARVLKGLGITETDSSEEHSVRGFWPQCQSLSHAFKFLPRHGVQCSVASVSTDSDLVPVAPFCPGHSVAHWAPGPIATDSVTVSGHSDMGAEPQVLTNWISTYIIRDPSLRLAIMSHKDTYHCDSASLWQWISGSVRQIMSLVSSAKRCYLPAWGHPWQSLRRKKSVPTVSVRMRRLRYVDVWMYVLMSGFMYVSSHKAQEAAGAAAGALQLQLQEPWSMQFM